MEFPNDIQHIIIRKMDIDTRRALGIFVKLSIPENLKGKIASTFLHKHVVTNNQNIIFVSLGDRKLKVQNGNRIDSYVYRLRRTFDGASMASDEVLHVPKHGKHIRQLYL